MEGYRTRLTGLTDAEAGSLFLAGLPGPAGELGPGTVLASAQLKVEAALPGELAEQARRVRERFHLDAPAWFRDADPVPYLEPVARAVGERRVLRAHHRRRRGEVHREVRPLGLVLTGGIRSLVALAEDTVRTYRVSRFRAVEETGEAFTRPAGCGSHRAGRSCCRCSSVRRGYGRSRTRDRRTSRDGSRRSCPSSRRRSRPAICSGWASRRRCSVRRDCGRRSRRPWRCSRTGTPPGRHPGDRKFPRNSQPAKY
ncbi:hypothetical protein GCM10010398_39610 [Streptomyces fimbriatus]